MIVKPKIRGFICTTAHPVGCAQYVQEQIDYVRKKGAVSNGPKNVLVIGASTGYGLASRIVSAFGCNAGTIGVVFERPAENNRTATAGWYNTVAFEQKALREGLFAKTINGDAFSDEVKEQIKKILKENNIKLDLVVYSLASPRRQHPKTGLLAKSVLKPIGAPYTNKSIDLTNDRLEQVSLPPASSEEIEQTVSVMGGEDWAMWIDMLQKEKFLNTGFKTVAYSYMGPEITRSIYRNGTIGKAKEHLEKTAKDLDLKLKPLQGKAVISVNKALVTQSSSAIPFIPLYFVLLNKVMNEKGVNEDCIAQIYRLFKDYLCTSNQWKTDAQGLIRVDDFELREDIQKEVNRRWEALSEETLHTFADMEGYHKDFLKLFGFGLNNVNYDVDVDIDVNIPSVNPVPPQS